MYDTQLTLIAMFLVSIITIGVLSYPDTLNIVVPSKFEKKARETHGDQ